MCSRYFLDAEGNVIAYTFRVPPAPGLRKRFNIAPTQMAPVVRLDGEGRRELALLRWGLVPSWAKDVKVGTAMINARSETLDSKPAFRAALASRRCVVPATGFFEWQGAPGRKQPYAITVPQAPLFAFAGLWERWKPAEGEPVETFTIATTDANEAVARIHDRMPAILPPEAVDAWLAGPPEAAHALLRPYEGEVALRAVGTYVSNVNHEGPECLEDARPGPQQQSLL